MGGALLRFAIGALVGLVVTAIEFIVFLLPIPNAVPLVLLGLLNVGLSWLTAEFGWWRMRHSNPPLPATQNSALYWFVRLFLNLGQIVMRLLLVAASVMLILLVSWLVGVTSSDWTVKLLQAAAWPAVVALAIVLAVGTQSGTQLFKSITSRLKKVSALGVDLELTVQVAKQVQYNVETGFAEYRQRINAEFDRQVRIKQIDSLLAEVAYESMTETFRPNGPQGFKPVMPTQYRCTVHIQDVLLQGALYQLLDYYPIGGGKGRPFSLRYGIIGLAWRLGEDRYNGRVLAQPQQIEKTLVKDWAMTWPEAREAQQKGVNSLVCVLLRDPKGLPAGILYFDAKAEDAFGPDAQMQALVNLAKTKCQVHLLTQAIVDLGEEMRKLGPALKLLT